MRCIHIALLCVQEKTADKPTMNRVVLMLGSDSLSVPLPSEPGFFIRSNNTTSDISLVSDHSNSKDINESDHSNIESAQASANEASITEVYPC
ncbi:hypothetical protein L484_006316 [Morus notabilis]|uniref:S-locus receptor kinase C-terminal domain-containing protein n=1 Tax=Morus notabilis TaxID=981085 RepID=W9QR59_9ROSA|nr:hypothetical protein L484_006316 [Morus notabilis]